MLSRDQILQANDITHVDVDVPEWGGVVRVRMLTGIEREAFENYFTAPGKKVDLRARLCSTCLVDENGARLFADADIPALAAKSGAALDRVYEAIKRLNKLSKEDVEDLEKN